MSNNKLLDPQHKNIILKIIRAYLPATVIQVFGSRARGDAKTHSDLDISLNNKTRIDLALIAKIKSSLSETNIPYPIDIVDYHRVSEDFQKVINKTAVKWE